MGMDEEHWQYYVASLTMSGILKILNEFVASKSMRVQQYKKIEFLSATGWLRTGLGR